LSNLAQPLNIQLHKSSKALKETQWERIRTKKNVFLSLPFKHSFENNHQNIQHLYYCIEDPQNEVIGYAQQFMLGGNKINSYQKKNRLSLGLKSGLLNLLKLKVVALGNGLLTNIENISATKLQDKKAFVKQLIQQIEKDTKVNKVIIPDHFFEAIGLNHPNEHFPKLIQVEVEEEMILPLRKNWQTFDDYHNSLKKKYRNRLKSVLKKSQDIRVKTLSKKDLNQHQDTIQSLFEKVQKNSSFGAMAFNAKIFQDLVELSEPKCLVYGYFLKDKMVGFSSELMDQNSLYSYFIGLDYNYNNKYRIYERILNESVKNGIEKEKKQVVFGRTAAEFKSNVGAEPKTSYIYIYIKSPLLRMLFSPILSNIKPKKWIQRRPFN